MKTQDTRTNPTEITLSDQSFNRLTFVRLGDEKTANATRYVYDGRGYKFVDCPTTGDICSEPKENRSPFRMDACPLFGAWDDAEERFFAFCSADCFDPPLYLVNARTWEDAYESFTDEFIDVIAVDDFEHELQLEAMEMAHKEGVADDWRNAKDFASAWDAFGPKEAWLAKAEEYLTSNGVISYNPNGKPYWAENINGFELSLVKAERIG